MLSLITQTFIITMQQTYNFQSLTFSPQLLELRQKLIQPTVLHFPEGPASRIDTDKLKLRRREGSAEFSQELGREIMHSIDMKAAKSEQELRQKEREIRALIQRKRYVLPPVRQVRRISRNNTSNKLDNNELANSYMERNADRYVTPKKRGDQERKEQPMKQVSIFLKGSKSKTKSRKLVYYKPDQVRRTSLGKEESPSLQSLHLRHFKSELKLKGQGQGKHKRTKTEVRNKNMPEEYNFFEIETQFTQLLYVTFESIYHLNKDVSLSGLKRVPVVPRQEDLKAFLKVYEPVNEEIGIKTLLKSNFCSVQFGKNQVYVGEMIGKIRSGVGILFLPGHCYQGQWKNNEIIKGAQITKDGVYKGTFHENRRSGEGEMQWCNGQLYSGEWFKGLQHGNGLWINPRGESYKGEWRNGKPEGIGSLVIKNTHNSKSGRRFKGAFVNGKQQGFGRQTFANGDSFEGIYREDKPDGRGVYAWAEGSVYEGEFQQGNREGMGQLKTSFNLIYKGEYCNDRPEGQCEIILPNGDTYYGMVKGGKKNGKGTLRVRMSKEVFNGYWKDDFFVDKDEAGSVQ